MLLVTEISDLSPSACLSLEQGRIEEPRKAEAKKLIETNRSCFKVIGDTPFEISRTPFRDSEPGSTCSLI